MAGADESPDTPVQPPAPRTAPAPATPGEVVPEEDLTPPFGPPGSWFAAQYRSGPLPEAAEFDRYETTLPGAADRILRLNERAMDLTEAEAGHRHTIETKIVDGNLQNQSRGQIIATFFGVVGFAAAIAFVVAGEDVAAFIAVLVPLGAFISRFIRRPNGS
jgi:uncharacterized membrane protein